MAAGWPSILIGGYVLIISRRRSSLPLMVPLRYLSVVLCLFHVFRGPNGWDWAENVFVCIVMCFCRFEDRFELW